MASESFRNRLERSARASGPVVAERYFDLDGRAKAVRVRIGKPRRDPKTGNHWCTFAVSGLGRGLGFKVWGGDSLQALQLAIRAAGELLRDEGHGLSWCGDADLGFARTLPTFLSLPAQSRIERVVDRELKNFERPAPRKRRAR